MKTISLMNHDQARHASTLEKLREIYRKALVLRHGKHLVTVNTFTDQFEPLCPDVLVGLAKWIGERMAGVVCDVVAGEEDKGAHLVTAVSLHTGLPFVLARWYVYPVTLANPSATLVEVRSEYFSGTLILNGIRPEAQVVIVDDTISTGGTLIALIRAIRSRGAVVSKAFAIVEKAGSGGVANVLEATGISVETFLTIETTSAGVVFP